MQAKLQHDTRYTHPVGQGTRASGEWALTYVIWPMLVDRWCLLLMRATPRATVTRHLTHDNCDMTYANWPLSNAKGVTVKQGSNNWTRYEVGDHRSGSGAAAGGQGKIMGEWFPFKFSNFFSKKWPTNSDLESLDISAWSFHQWHTSMSPQTCSLKVLLLQYQRLTPMATYKHPSP